MDSERALLLRVLLVKKEAEATVRGMKDFTLLKSWMTITGHIDALRRIEGNRYVHSGQQLVSFRFVKDETYANVDDKNFEIPKYATIYAKGDGILHYVPCTRRKQRYLDYFSPLIRMKTFQEKSTNRSDKP